MAKFSLPVVLDWFPLPQTPLSPTTALPSSQPLGTDNPFFFFFAKANIHLPTISGDTLSALAQTAGIVWLVWMVFSLVVVGLWHWDYRHANRSTGTLGSHDDDENDFRLWLGTSTGHLAQLGHSTNLAPNQHVSLTLEDATQNILILGGIGSGKTTRAQCTRC